MAGVAQKLELVVLDKHGERVKNGKVTAEILQENGAYVRKRNQAGDLYWGVPEPVAPDVGRGVGPGQRPVHLLSFDLTWGGTYIVSATYQGPEGQAFVAAAHLQAEGDILWDDYSNRDRPFEVLDLVAGQEVYEPGQTAVIYLQPRRKISRYLVTMEQDRVLSHKVVEAQAGAQRLEIPIKDAYSPNVFVSRSWGWGPEASFRGGPRPMTPRRPGSIFGTLNLPVRRRSSP